MDPNLEKRVNCSSSPEWACTRNSWPRTFLACDRFRRLLLASCCWCSQKVYISAPYPFTILSCRALLRWISGRLVVFLFGDMGGPVVQLRLTWRMFSLASLMLWPFQQPGVVNVKLLKSGRRLSICNCQSQNQLKRMFKWTHIGCNQHYTINLHTQTFV